MYSNSPGSQWHKIKAGSDLRRLRRPTGLGLAQAAKKGADQGDTGISKL